MQERIIIIDFGSQYTQLIARRVREAGVYSEVHPFHKLPALGQDVLGVILSGSPASVLDSDAPKIDLNGLLGQKPVLAICYGAQLIAQSLGGEVQRSQHREYGPARLAESATSHPLFASVPESSKVWMSHGDTILQLPDGYEALRSSNNIPVAAFHQQANGQAPVLGLQFHPEVTHSEAGSTILKNFVIDICGCSGDWTTASFIQTTVSQLREQIGQDQVVLGLSGGVDSTVAAALLHEAIGDQLFGVFINNGLLRKNEFPDVLKAYEGMGLNVIGIDASERFYRALSGLSEPEAKRKAIGRVFVEEFQDHAKTLQNVEWLGQGTIYPDVIESAPVHGPSVTIKSHHNVGGLPDLLHLKVVEPLRNLFKDEVRKVGRAMDLPEQILGRHPFPGPGLGIRILGEVTPESVSILQEADDIFISALRKFNVYNDVWQAATILLPVKTVGVMGDERTYESVVALRAVHSVDGMTADWVRLPEELLATVSSDIINKVRGVNRVVYDISTKPPATIEWE